MMKKLFALALLLLSFAAPAHADATLGIIAVVNDDAITNNDLDGRVRLALLGSGIQSTPDILARLRGQVLRSLIDERLQLQEAKKFEITVDDKEIDEQIAKLAQQNNMTPEKLKPFFASKGVSLNVLREQMRANILWAKVVQRKIRPQVQISDEEVDDEIARLSANAGKAEYLAAEIFLPVTSPQQEQGVQQAASRLIEQMSKGARFSSIARQFSQAATAAAGGDLGWVQTGQLEPELNEALSRMSPGTVSPPIRTAGGFHILMLRDMRQTRAVGAPKPEQMAFNLRQVLVSTVGTTVQAASHKLESLRGQAKSCSDMERLAKAQGDDRKGDIGTIGYPQLPTALQGIIAALPEKTPSAPLQNDRGVLFLMVCERSPLPGAEIKPAAGSIDREQVTNAIGAQRLEMLVRRNMRDLRQSAFIDIRG